MGSYFNRIPIGISISIGIQKDFNRIPMDVIGFQ